MKKTSAPKTKHKDTRKLQNAAGMNDMRTATGAPVSGPSGPGTWVYSADPNHPMNCMPGNAGYGS